MTVTRAAIGELTERVTIQARMPTPDTQGGRAVVYGGTGAGPLEGGREVTVWAAVRPLAAAERLQVEAIGSHVSFEVEIRYRGDLTAGMRVRWTPYRATTSKVLEIHGVTMLGRDRLVLHCGEVS